MTVQQTSHDAYDEIKPDVPTLRQRVFAFIVRHGGATDEEMQNTLGMRANTQRPRRRELVQQGMVRDSGKTRKTQSGREAIVWVPATAKEERQQTLFDSHEYGGGG